MSEAIDANFSEVESSESKQPIRAFTLKIEFAEEGVQMHVNTNLSTLEQLGAVQLWTANILRDLTNAKAQDSDNV